MNAPDLDEQKRGPTDSWNSMSLWEKCWVVMCALDESADLRLERRVQKLERQIAEMRRVAAGAK